MTNLKNKVTVTTSAEAQYIGNEYWFICNVAWSL